MQFQPYICRLVFLLILLISSVPCQFVSYCVLWISGGYAAGYYSYKVMISYHSLFFMIVPFLLSSDGWIWSGFIYVIGCHGSNIYESFLPMK